MLCFLKGSQDYFQLVLLWLLRYMRLENSEGAFDIINVRTQTAYTEESKDMTVGNLLQKQSGSLSPHLNLSYVIYSLVFENSSAWFQLRNFPRGNLDEPQNALTTYHLWCKVMVEHQTEVVHKNLTPFLCFAVFLSRGRICFQDPVKEAKNIMIYKHCSAKWSHKQVHSQRVAQ